MSFLSLQMNAFDQKNAKQKAFGSDFWTQTKLETDLMTNSDKGEKYSENAMYKNSERNVFMHRPS